MKILIIGGKLQGVEANYLAKKANWETVIIDKDSNVPAKLLCDKFYQFDILSNYSKFLKIATDVDLVVPAIENNNVLKFLKDISLKNNIPIALDFNSYEISSSKKLSNELFMKNSIPIPQYYPNCKFPVIVKPSNLSGSQGVKKIKTLQELKKYLIYENCDEIIQEFIEGDLYSLEVIGCGNKFNTYQITNLEIDNNYDCKRVSAPLKISFELEKQLRLITLKVAKLLNLIGIMDIEVVNDQGKLKVLEIDARLPSQTPTVVFNSSGINLLKEVYNAFVNNKLYEKKITAHKAVIYEHLYINDNVMMSLGEHIIANAGPLNYVKNFFGADEALTTYKSNLRTWVATLIITESNMTDAYVKRLEVLNNIKKHCHIREYIDYSPE